MMSALRTSQSSDEQSPRIKAEERRDAMELSVIGVIVTVLGSGSLGTVLGVWVQGPPT